MKLYKMLLLGFVFLMSVTEVMASPAVVIGEQSRSFYYGGRPRRIVTYLVQTNYGTFAMERCNSDWNRWSAPPQIYVGSMVAVVGNCISKT